MDLGLDGKVIIVTGGAKGIGEAISIGVANENGIPVIVGRSKDSAESLSRQLQSEGHKCHNISIELGSEEASKKVIDDTIQQYGRIDGLVNNAGTNDGIGLESGTPEQFVGSLRKNLHHYYSLAHFALPYLKKSQGSIVNISSKAAVTGQGGTSAYAAAKGAQLALTREWAVELLKYSIRVNALIPAEVMTPQYQRWIQTLDNPENKLEEISKNIPLGNRMTTSEEISNMVIFLLSDKASHITGQHLYVDGGYVHLDRALSTLNK